MHRFSFHITYAISFAWQLGFLIAVSLIGFLWIGLWLDQYFRTSPLFALIGLFVGFTVIIYEVFHSLKPLLKNPPPHD